jgi:hypothetical protein
LGSERQYKVQIEKWNLERNVKQHEKKYIVKKVQYRKQAMNKDTGYIGVRGHRINKEKLDRWMREQDNSMLESTVPRNFNRSTSSVPYANYIQKHHLESASTLVLIQDLLHHFCLIFRSHWKPLPAYQVKEMISIRY